MDLLWIALVVLLWPEEIGKTAARISIAYRRTMRDE